MHNDYRKADEIIEAHQNVSGEIGEYRPRSRTIDELHHKFGMNEIGKVTPKEGAVRN